MSAYGYWCIKGCGKRVVLFAYARKGYKSFGRWKCSVCGFEHLKSQLEPRKIHNSRKGVPSDA